MFSGGDNSKSSSSRNRTSRRFTSLDRRRIAQLTKWCTLFIILESTSVGSGLITSTSSSTTSASTLTTTSSSMTSISSSSNTATTTTSSSSSHSWLESTSPSSTGSPYTSPLATADELDAQLPHFEALVQESPNSSRGKTLPLLGSGALKESASQTGSIGKRGPVSGSSSSRPSTTSGYDSLTSRRSPPSTSIVPESVGLAAGTGSASGSSFSKITSANLILAEGGPGESGKIGPGQKVPVGFSGSSVGKVAGKSANGRSVASELEPSGNRLEGGDATTAEGNFSKMYFETDNHTTIASQVGSIAVLPCAVRNIGEGVVSWIRRKDYHLLTIGFTTYSSDERFNIIHSEDTEVSNGCYCYVRSQLDTEWPLQIKYVQLRDAGLYECQVSTHPPTSIFVKLDVVEAKAEIFGPSEKYLKPGSMLRLTCRVVQSNEPPLYIFWYHNNRMINYDAHRGVNVSTEADNRYSELVISHTNTLNSGNYSCVSNNAVAASTLVHILNGENPAAMQHGDHGNAVLVASHIHLPLAIVTYQVINFVLNMH
uniref:Ig-like domain-containing protein n=1 Tax=Anopheles epiroticus TaxID=199890 RepID=A0A182PFS5_9DIPT